MQWVPEAFPPRVKMPGLDADHVPPSVAEVKKARSYSYTVPYVFVM
jgi:hypothetical protein